MGRIGLRQQRWVRLREVPENPLAGPLNLLSSSGPQPTDRTMLLVRRYNLEDELKHHSSNLLPRLYEITKQEPSADKLYSLSELAYLAAKRAEPINRQRALELHTLAMVNGYNYLFDARFGRFRNPYDPEFRGACDLYNGALESALRIINRRGGLVPGSTHTIRTANQTIEATIVLRAPGWQPDDFAGFHFVSDYEVNGLQNHYHTYGLGVPLIAVRKHHDPPAPQEKFYPPGMSVPVTAFLRVLPERTPGSSHHIAQLELYDPLNMSELNVDGRRVPVESDLTTPLAYALNQKELRDLDSSTVGFLNPAKTEKLQGLYMLEPYQPGKIPVIMIHGVWSSPITWMAMFNDLRGRRRFATAINSGSTCIPVGNRSGTARPTCAATWPRPAKHSIPAANRRRSTRWCWSDIAWADWSPGCKPSIAARIFGTSLPTSHFRLSRRQPRRARNWPARFSFARTPRSAV